MNYLETFSSTLPIIFLVIAGIVFRITGFVQEGTIQDFKKLVVGFSLPLLLFKAFSTMRFELHYLIIVATIFTACVVVMLISMKMQFFPGLSSRYSSFLMVGFEAGMLGYAMFSSIYGSENISYFAVIDLGQVLFVFFVLITRLEFQQSRRLSPGQTLVKFLQTPVILGIIAGILANLTGFYLFLTRWPVTNSLLATAEIFASLTTPLVAIFIGYELRLRMSGIWLPLQTVLLRLVVWVGLAVGFNLLVIRQMLHLDPMFEAAVLLMAVLPAPFVIPLYLRAGDEKDREYILNTLSLGTIAALIGGVLVRIIY